MYFAKKYPDFSVGKIQNIISKYEVAKLRKMIHEIDPDAFIIMNDDIDVDGHFIKRL